MTVPEFLGTLLAMFVVLMFGYFVTHKLEGSRPTTIANLLLLVPVVPLVLVGTVRFVLSGDAMDFLPFFAGLGWFYALALVVIYVKPVRERLTEIEKGELG